MEVQCWSNGLKAKAKADQQIDMAMVEMDLVVIVETDAMVVVAVDRSNVTNVVNEATLPEIVAIDEIDEEAVRDTDEIVAVTDEAEIDTIVVETDMIEAAIDMIAVVIDTIAAEIVIVQERDVTETEVKTETNERVERGKFF